MATRYNTEYVKTLTALIDQADLHDRRPPERYEPGTLLDLKVTGVCPEARGQVKLRIESFAGGGFAGQVYRTTLLELDPPDLSRIGLKSGGTYAVKIHIPPTSGARLFRDGVYWLGYQGAFPAQVDPNAARIGAIWQKLIRRGAKSRFGEERCVADVHATFFDPEMRSFGEIIEWVEGRIWRLEIDRELFRRKREAAVTTDSSREYLAKKRFMADFVHLLHEMGAEELARQYEWWTAKSQPNVLKRRDSGERGGDGLTAIDFRPGLALLFFLPMSPVDFKLILRGCRRGSLVQFDRGDLEKLQGYLREHSEEFEDLMPAVEELLSAEPLYRNSLPDVTRHGFRLFWESSLRREVKSGLVRGWKSHRLVDDAHVGILENSVFPFILFYLLGGVPFLGSRIRRLWGSSDYRRHVKACFASIDYVRRSLRVRQAECLMGWHRRGRIGENGIEFFLRHPLVFTMIRVFPGLLPLPAKLHRALIDWKYLMEKGRETVIFPLHFYRHPGFRTAWLTKEVDEGVREGLLKTTERDRIQAQISDPFIQKYLKCMAVHFCTFPITRVVMLLVAVWAYVRFGDTWQESMGYALAALLIIGVILPISPGSLVRGSYVVYLMIRERNVRNYWLAAVVSFWRAVGYLGFPLQMVKEFPALSRLLASRWVSRATRIVPVFGESGALLEHMVFDMCVNTPLSIKDAIQTKKRHSREKVPGLSREGIEEKGEALQEQADALPGIEDLEGREAPQKAGGE